MYVIQTLGRGGAEKQVCHIADGLRPFGYEPMVVSVLSFEEPSWLGYLRARGIPVAMLRVPLGLSLFDWRLPYGFMQLVVAIRRFRPDTLLSFIYPTVIWANLAATLARVPIRIACARECGVLRAQKALPQWLEGLAYRHTTHVVANSAAVTDGLCGGTGLRREDMSIIPNGVELPPLSHTRSQEARIRLRLSQEDVIIGLVANFLPYKNQLMLIHAAQEVIRQEPHIRFLLVGGYGHGYRQQVEGAIARGRLESSVRILGHVEDISDVAAAIDIGVLCSETEGLSNTILEYMAYGKPVVATRVGGNGELVIDGQTGYLVNLDDVPSLADAILRLVRDPGLRAAMGHNGRARAERDFAWPMVLQRWHALLERCGNAEKMNGH